MPKHETKIYNLILKKKRDGVNQIALVEDPAINSGWQAFSAKKEYMFADKKKQMLYGAIMIPDKQILRVGDNGNKYFVKFEQKQIDKMLYKYMAEARTNEFNLHHDANQQADVVTVESWIKGKEEDKSNVMGLADVPHGSWIIGAKVNSKEIWSKVESGELTGFSLEGFFTEEEIKFNSNQTNNTYMSKPEGFKQKLAKVLGLANEEPKNEEQTLEAVQVELAEGGMIFYDEEQQTVFAVMEDGTQGEALGDGEYALADGRILEVTAGVVTNITTEQEQSKVEDENALIGVLKEMNEQISSLISSNEQMSKELEEVKSVQKAFASQTPASGNGKKQTTKNTGVTRLN